MTEPSQTNLQGGQATVDGVAGEPDRTRFQKGGEQ